jgi:hypothetical protein
MTVFQAIIGRRIYGNYALDRVGIASGE